MDIFLTPRQATLANKQHELAKQSQLLQLREIEHVQRDQLIETGDILRITEERQLDHDRNIGRRSITPQMKPIEQVEQSNIQLQIAERQLLVAERQVQIAQTHLSHIDSDRFASQLGQQGEFRNAAYLKKQADIYLSDALDLVKRARHTATFAELGALQRMNSFKKEKPKNSSDEIDAPDYDMTMKRPPGHHALRDVPEDYDMTIKRPNSPQPPESTPNNRPAGFQYPDKDSPYYRSPGVIEGAGEGFKNQNAPPIMPQSAPSVVTTVPLPLEKKKDNCCRNFIIVLFILAILGGGGFALYWFLFKDK